MTVDVNASDSSYAGRSAYFAGVLKTLGYKVTIRRLAQWRGADPSTFYTDSRHETQIFYAFGWLADFPLPYNFSNALFSCSAFKKATPLNQNASEFCNRDIDGIAAHAHERDAVGDPAAANDLWRQVDQKLTDASPAIFTVTWKVNTLISPNLHNYTRTLLGLAIFDQMWVQ